MKRLPLIALAALLASAATPVPAAQSAGARLNALLADEWQWYAQQRPEDATERGDNRYNDRLRDASAEAVAARKAYRAGLAARLQTIERAQLGGQDRLSYDVFGRQLAVARRMDAIFGALPFAQEDDWAPVTQFEGPQFWLPQMAASTPFRTVADYEAYLKRLAAVPRLLEQLQQRMQVGIDTGWLPAGAALVRVPAQFEAHVAADPTALPLYRPFTRFGEDVPAAERKRLAEAGARVLSEQVVPAMRAMKAFYESKYLPAALARKGIGASDLPGGPDYYQAVIAEMTTTSMSAREIHELGLREVDRIEAEMDRVMRSTGFAGSREEFARFLHESPQFYYATGEELLAGYRDIAKRADAELPALFAELPRTPYGVRPEEAFEGDNADHYVPSAGDGSRAGFFEANINNVKMRPKYDMESLLLHEAVPGHHLQISRAQEIKGLPDFRRFIWLVAYGEGWALYAESLGDEMGFYKDPYSKFGQLSAEMWRACRLVVDTGMHAFGWSREQAIAYLKQRALISNDYAAAEIDRYLVMPGQALGYKLGELKIKALRARARAALGERFDLRRFHNAVLDDGPLPLDVLEARIDEWIAAQKRSDTAAGAPAGAGGGQPAQFAR
jgi:uncharacterized protein (DUF885 family)